MTDAYVVDAVRTPIGKVNGAFARIELENLLAPLISALLQRNGVSGLDIDEVIVGNAAGPGGNPARVALLAANLPLTVPGLTIDRQCGSGLEAINFGARLIQSGAASIVIAGGAESASTAPLRAKPGRRGAEPEYYHRARFSPDTIGDPDMGIAAENVATAFAVSRARQDKFAFSSHRKAVEAQQAGRFDDELITLTDINGRRIDRDECPRPDCTLASLAALNPVFKSDGTVTAGNACPVNDGAALVLLMSTDQWRGTHSGDRQRTGSPDTGNSQSAGGIGTTSLRFIDGEAAGVDPRLLGIGPVPAVRALLDRHKLSPGQLAQVEFNEAFAAQVLASMDQLQLDPATLNPAGGALALGHPYGASGAVLVTRLLHELNVGQIGLATLGIGGGMGLASLFECVPG